MRTKKVTHRSIAILKLPRSVPLLLTYARGIVTGMTANPQFASPFPPLGTVTAAIDDLDVAETAALTRARGAASMRDEKHSVLAAHLELLRAYVQSVADASPENAASIIESARLSVRKAAVPTSRAFTARQGPLSGAVKLYAKSAGDRAAYLWESSTDGGKTWVTAGVTLQAKKTILDLTPGSTVSFRYQPVTKAGEGDWSYPVSLIVT